MRKKMILLTFILLLSFNLGFAAESIPGLTWPHEIALEESPLPQTQETVTEIIGIPVLMYHHILPESMMADQAYNAAIISFESFKAQMQWLNDEGWQALSLDDLYGALSDQTPLPDKSFAITFDDGYASNLFFAFPTLNRYNYPAAEFMITANLEEDTRKWEGKKLSWKDAQAMSRLISIQSHSHAFHQMEDGQPLLGLRSQDEIQADLDYAWAEIDRHIEPGIRAFAYPYGFASQAAIQVLKNQGVKLAFTTETGYATKTSDPLLLPRFGITPSVSMEDFQAIFTTVSIQESIDKTPIDPVYPDQPDAGGQSPQETQEPIE